MRWLPYHGLDLPSRVPTSLTRVAVLLALALAPGSIVEAQPVREDLFVTDGSVEEIVVDGSTIYLGGTFTRVGPATGAAAPLSTITGMAVGLPQVLGTVHAVASDGAGGWFLGGQFTRVGGLPRLNLAHVASDYSVSDWAPEANSIVYALAISGSTVYAGGNFTNVGGQIRHRLAAISTVTGVPTGWQPNPDGIVYSIVVSGSTVYAGGAFFNVGELPRGRIAAISAMTGAPLAWNPNADGFVNALVVNGSTVYAGGLFTTIGSASRANLAALDVASGLATSWDPGPNGTVNTLALSGSNLYAGGEFTVIGGSTRLRVAAVNTATGSATAWDPAANFNVKSVLVSGSTVYVGGQFTFIGGQERNHLAAIAVDGLATSWNPAPSLPVNALGIDGTTVLAGGEFTSAGMVTRRRIAALDATTGMPTAWNPDINGTVNALAVSGSTVYAGGGFNLVGGQPRPRIAAISKSTGIATAWNPNASAQVLDLAVDGSTVYAAGTFATIGGSTRNSIAALDAGTGLATAWNPDANGLIYQMALSGSTVYAVGAFTNIGTAARDYVAALDATTGLATAWNPDSDNWVFAIAVSGSTVYLGGSFNFIGGQFRPSLAAVDAATGAVRAWNPNANSTVRALGVRGSTVYVGGDFNSVAGQFRSFLAAIDATTGQATSWNPNPNLGGSVRILTVTESDVYAGGFFANIGGLPVSFFASISHGSTYTNLLGPAWDPAGLVAADNALHNETISNGAGGSVLVWQTGGDRDLRALGLSANGRIAPGWFAGGTVVCDAVDVQSLNIDQSADPNLFAIPKSSVVPDGTGGLISAWLDARGSMQSIFAQRVTGSGYVQWAANGIPIGPAVVRAEDFPVVAAGDGGAFIAWSDSIDGSYNIYASRVTASGAAASGWNTSRGIAVTMVGGPQYAPAAADDGRGGLIVAWRDERMGSAEGDIFAQRMSPGGTAVWTTGGVAVCSQNDIQRAPGIITDERGGAIICWADNRIGGPARRPFAQRVDSLGVPQWTADGNEVATSSVDEWDLTADGTGGAIVAWRSGISLRAQRISSAGVKLWGPNGVELAAGVVLPSTPRVVTDGSGGAIVTWADDEALYSSHVNPDGSFAGGWTGTSVTTPDQVDAILPWATTDGSGGTIIAWTDKFTGDLNVQRIRYDGVVAAPPASAWQANGEAAATPVGIQRRPAVVSNAQGGAIIVWEDFRNPAPIGGRPYNLLGPGHAFVAGTRILESGETDAAWTANGDELAPSVDPQFEPTAVSNGMGGALVAWTEVTDTGSDIRAQHVQSNSTTFPGWPAGGMGLHTPGGDNTRPAMASDGAGGAIVAWQRDVGANGEDIVAQRVRAGGALTWSAAGLTLCSMAGDQTRPIVVEDGSGGAYIAWTDGRGVNTDIYGVHVDSTGNLVAGWAADGSAIIGAAGNQDLPAGVSDGVGGAVLVWSDGRGANRDIYAQRTADRQPQTWPASGVAVNTSDGDQTAPQLTADQVGGAIVAWEDDRAASNAIDVYAMRMLGDGVVSAAWPVAGLTLCAAAGDQLNPQLVSDGQGGAIVLWEDHRGGVDADIYAMGVTAGGTLDPRYPVDGLEVSTEDGGQNDVVLTTDGNGGTVVAWTDDRGADPDIYAMHLFGNSLPSPLTVGDAPVRTLALLAPPRPNPSRGSVTFAFEIAVESEAQLDVLDVAGRRVQRLVPERRLSAGAHVVRWDGRTSDGGPAPAGIYFARLRVNRAATSRRFALIR